MSSQQKAEPFALHRAILADDGMAIWNLLQQKADVNQPNEAGHIPLTLSIQKNQSGVVKMLVDAKAEVNKGGFEGVAPLYAAAASKNDSIVHYLLSMKAIADQETDLGVTAIMAAVELGCLPVVRILLVAKAQANQSVNDCTLLQKSAECGHTGVLLELLKSKADVDVQDSVGTTALSLAAQNGHSESVKSLLSAKADHSLVGGGGETALILSAQEGHRKIVSCLLMAKADVNKQVQSGFSPLLIAAYKAMDGKKADDYKAVVCLLLKHGANLPLALEVGRRCDRASAVCSLLLQQAALAETQLVKTTRLGGGGGSK